MSSAGRTYVFIFRISWRTIPRNFSLSDLSMLDRLSNLRENREISSPVLLFVPWYTYSLDAAEGDRTL